MSNEILKVQCTHCGEISEYELPSTQMIVNRDDFTDDLLNQGFTKGYLKGREDAIDECIAIIKAMHNMNDVICGDWSNCYQIINRLEQIKEQK